MCGGISTGTEVCGGVPVQVCREEGRDVWRCMELKDEGSMCIGRT